MFLFRFIPLFGRKKRGWKKRKIRHGQANTMKQNNWVETERIKFHHNLFAQWTLDQRQIYELIHTFISYVETRRMFFFRELLQIFMGSFFQNQLTFTLWFEINWALTVNHWLCIQSYFFFFALQLSPFSAKTLII